MGWWTDHVVPRLTDAALRSHALDKARDLVCAGLHGRVLELGFGTGLNLDRLPSEVTAIGAVEPSDLSWRRSAPARSSTGVPVERVGLDGQAVAAESASYDAALCTFTLCTVPDPVAALGEVRRLLRAGGTLHFLEHGLAADAHTRVWQHRLDPWEQRLVGGCHLTRDPAALVEQAGLRITHLETGPLAGVRGPAALTYAYLGRARTGPGV